MPSATEPTYQVDTTSTPCNIDRTGWHIHDRRECLAVRPTRAQAEKSCRNDAGRHITMYDSTGRISSQWVDGTKLSDGAVS